ncbi:uncharacterized protein DS421_1g33050 [Arachis hypogaea]|nr:uncharacterized protein DS421_1g33050 [Arachis hypogaea]
MRRLAKGLCSDAGATILPGSVGDTDALLDWVRRRRQCSPRLARCNDDVAIVNGMTSETQTCEKKVGASCCRQ